MLIVFVQKCCYKIYSVTSVRQPLNTRVPLKPSALSFGQIITTFGGFFPTRNVALERAIHLAGGEAALAKRVLFLSRSQQVFNLWHVVHKPFSYSFAVLALIHIVVVMMMGYF